METAGQSVNKTYDPKQTWRIPDVGYNINPTRRSTWGCEVNPVPFGCLRCPSPECVYDMAPDTSLCAGSGESVANTSVTSGPGLFRCGACDRPDIAVEEIGRGVYVAANHNVRQAYVPA